MRYDEETKARAVDMVRAGMSNQEIAETIGVTPSTISNWAIAAGVKRGRGGGCVAVNNNRRHNAGSRRRTEKAREYLAGRFDVVKEVRPNHFIIRCLTCGHEFERYVDTNCQTTCPECTSREVERNEEKRMMAAMRRAIVRALRGVVKVKKREEQERVFLDAVHVCKECGKEFTLRELREDNPWNYSDNPTFCSRSCGKRFNKRESRHRRRERGERRHCGSVSLHELEIRDNNTCYLCGRKTNRSDYFVDERGNFTAGPTYPSIDHVVPLSKGGAHDMGNVKLACCRCNAIKGNRSVREAKEVIRKSDREWL